MRNTVLFFPTMRCQLKCAYCHFTTDARRIPYEWEGYGEKHVVEREITAREALDGLAFLAPYTIEFTGGEPLLWEGFREFVAGMPDGSDWAITSNTLEPVKDIDLSRCSFWTASWHHDSERFQENVMYLKAKLQPGSVTVSFVVRKETDDIRTKCAAAQVWMANGLRPNILREMNPGVFWGGSEEWKYLLSLRALRWNVVEDEIPESYEFSSGYLCEGGHNYIAVMPDGQAYRCYSDAMNGSALGRIGSPFPMRDSPAACNRPCLGCALDNHAHVRKLEAAS